MPEQVNQSLHSKCVVLANDSIATSPTGVEVGTLIVSGSKLLIRGASAWETVTSSS